VRAMTRGVHDDQRIILHFFVHIPADLDWRNDVIGTLQGKAWIGDPI
jgi:hypothetical protein